MTQVSAVLLAVAAAVATGPAATGTLTIAVDNVRDAKGRVHVDICPEAKFLKDGCPFSLSVPAVTGETVLVVRGLPPGRYAAQAFHDENDNGKVDRVLFGIPKEGVGFSRDAPIHLSPPKWADAVFAYDGKPGAIRFALRYFLGPSGPPKAR